MCDEQNDGQHTAELAARLNSETAIITWPELVRHFARGALIHVTHELDLVETAVCMAQDDSGTLNTWLASGALRRASDDDARDWVAREPEFWCVVIAPWVLVQEKPSDPPATVATPEVMH